jgi:hypothetical protein
LTCTNHEMVGSILSLPSVLVAELGLINPCKRSATLNLRQFMSIRRAIWEKKTRRGYIVQKILAFHDRIIICANTDLGA